METLDFLLSRPIALFVVLAIGAAIGIAVEKIATQADQDKRKAYWRGRNAGKAKRGGNVHPIKPVKEAEARSADFAADQLKIVSKSHFTSRSLLNRVSNSRDILCQPWAGMMAGQSNLCSNVPCDAKQS